MEGEHSLRSATLFAYMAFKSCLFFPVIMNKSNPMRLLCSGLI